MVQKILPVYYFKIIKKENCSWPVSMGEGCGALYAPNAFEKLLDVVLEEVGVDLLVLARHLLHEVHLHPVEH